VSKSIGALRDQSSRGVAVGGGALQCVDVRQQAAFGVVAQLFFAAVGLDDGFELAGMVAAFTVRVRQEAGP
jgi:hypothetical protein